MLPDNLIDFVQREGEDCESWAKHVSIRSPNGVVRFLYCVHNSHSSFCASWLVTAGQATNQPQFVQVFMSNKSLISHFLRHILNE